MRVTRVDEFAQAVWWMLAHGLLVQLQHHVYVSLSTRQSAVAKYLADNQLTESIGYFEQFVSPSRVLLFPFALTHSHPAEQMAANPAKRTHV